MDDARTGLSREEKEIVREGAARPELEKPHEGAFSYAHEDGETRYAREARYAGRDEDSEGRYGIESQILKPRPPVHPPEKKKR